MKNIIPLVLLIIFSISTSSAQGVKGKKDPVGNWKFETTYSPEGYTSGTFTVGYTENKYSAIMVVTGSDYQYPGENVSFQNDSLIFSLYVEGEIVKVSMKLESNEKMSGKAVYSGGEIPITLARLTEESQKK